MAGGYIFPIRMQVYESVCFVRIVRITEDILRISKFLTPKSVFSLLLFLCLMLPINKIINPFQLLSALCVPETVPGTLSIYL